MTPTLQLVPRQLIYHPLCSDFHRGLLGYCLTPGHENSVILKIGRNMLLGIFYRVALHDVGGFQELIRLRVFRLLFHSRLR